MAKQASHPVTLEDTVILGRIGTLSTARWNTFTRSHRRLLLRRRRRRLGLIMLIPEVTLVLSQASGAPTFSTLTPSPTKTFSAQYNAVLAFRSLVSFFQIFNQSARNILSGRRQGDIWQKFWNVSIHLVNKRSSSFLWHYTFSDGCSLCCCWCCWLLLFLLLCCSFCSWLSLTMILLVVVVSAVVVDAGCCFSSHHCVVLAKVVGVSVGGR